MANKEELREKETAEFLTETIKGLKALIKTSRIALSTLREEESKRGSSDE